MLSAIGQCHVKAADTKEPSADKAALIKGNNEFAFELYGKLRGKEGNLFFSPYSISTALAMTYGGARGQTAEEMAKTLHFSLDQARLHPAFAELIREINGYGMPQEYQLSVANALWLQQDYPFQPGYLKLVKENYGARLRPVDFNGNSEGARQLINAWVEKQTLEKIKELLKSDDVTSLTRLVLTNAIYFKGDWSRPFEKKDTKDEDFRVAGDRKVKVAMMHRTAEFRWSPTDTFQALEMGYGDGELAMVVLLPNKVDGLAQLEEELTSGKLTPWLAKFHYYHPRQVKVAVPRFKATAEFQLKDVLVEMGMARAFGAEADFTGITNSRLFISKVVHKAFVDVNEEGTEAAAATAVLLAETARPIAPAEFRADHPFLFLIRDNRNGSILFLGRLSEP
jgi:serpin B